MAALLSAQSGARCEGLQAGFAPPALRALGCLAKFPVELRKLGQGLPLVLAEFIRANVPRRLRPEPLSKSPIFFDDGLVALDD